MINDLQKEVAVKIIRRGLEESAKSLAYFTKSSTKIQLSQDFTITENPTFKPDFIEKKGELYLMSTELIGDMQGIAYLIFTQDEVDSIMDRFYKGKSFDEEKYKKKSEALILEITNIITAAVVSQFANFFDYSTYGDVPNKKIVHVDNLADEIKSYVSKSNILVDFRAKLITDGVNVVPEFIWLVDESFINGVKKDPQIH